MRRHVLVTAVALVAAAAAGYSARAAARVELTKPLGASTPVSWLALAEKPCEHRGRTVEFAFQFHGRPDRWQAGPTRFGPAAFAAISGWADEQFPWIVEEFDHPGVRVYVRRGSDAERAFADARPHQRFHATGVVREVWRDRPWIEVVDAYALGEEIGEATVFHAGRALELMEEGTFVLADEALEQALGAPLPAAARDELARLREICRAEMAQPKPPPIRPRR